MAAKKQAAKKPSIRKTTARPFQVFKNGKPISKGKIFQCPTDCQTLTVSTGVTPSQLIIVL